MMIPSRRLFLGGLLSALAAPAIVHMANIMPVRSFIILPGPTFDSFDNLIPDGMQYQWMSPIGLGYDVTKNAIDSNLYGGPALESWRPVHAGRHKDQFTIGGDTIIVAGCVLCERPKVHHVAARGAEIEKAYSLSDQWARKAMADGFSGHVKPITGPTDTFTTVTDFGKRTERYG